MTELIKFESTTYKNESDLKRRTFKCNECKKFYHKTRQYVCDEWCDPDVGFDSKGKLTIIRREYVCDKCDEIRCKDRYNQSCETRVRN